jgi:hypothetical protein
MLPIKFQFIWPRGFRGEDFFLIGQSETRIACTVVAMFGNGSGQDEHSL